MLRALLGCPGVPGFSTCKPYVPCFLTLTARCSDPGIPDNGVKEGDNYRSKANVTFKCNPPLELIGSRVIFCQDGKWSDSKPICSSK